jgi:hypothetical protein
MTPAQRAAARRRIAQALADIDRLLPGTVTMRTGPCGKTACRCHGDPPQLHGPFISWTRKVAGKTVTRILSPQQWADYQSWFDNARRAKALLSDLEALSLQQVDDDPRWGAK